MLSFAHASPSSTSPRKRLDTEVSASSGHGWNQSMTTQLTSAGNRLVRTLIGSPMGEKQRMTCRLSRTKSVDKTPVPISNAMHSAHPHGKGSRGSWPTTKQRDWIGSKLGGKVGMQAARHSLMNMSQQLSRVSGMPARLTIGRTLLMMSSMSSAGKRPGMLPEESKSFMKTRKRSSAICWSVKTARVEIRRHARQQAAARGAGSDPKVLTEGNTLAFEARFAVHDLQVGLEVVDAVPCGDYDLEGGEAVDKGCEARERLLAHATHTDHECVAARRLDDARDAADVAHCRGATKRGRKGVIAG